MRQWPVWLTDEQIQGLQVCRWPLQCFSFNSSSIPIELKLTRKSTVAHSSWDRDEEILVLIIFELHTSVALEIFVLCMSASSWQEKCSWNSAHLATPPHRSWSLANGQ